MARFIIYLRGMRLRYCSIDIGAYRGYYEYSDTLAVF
jgi:hypothetical protein